MIQRRDLLKSLTAASLLGVNAVATSSNASPLLRGPIENRKGPLFKTSLAAYSYREFLAPKKDKKPTMDLHGFIDECSSLQLDGTELTGYYMPEMPSEKYLRDLRLHCFRTGLNISGTATRNEFGWPEGHPNRQKEIDHVKRWIDYSVQLQAPTIRIFAGHPQLGNDEATTHRLMVAGMKEAAQYAGEKGVYLGLENHGGPTSTAEGLLRLIHDVDSPWLAANLDTGNFRGEMDPYQQMEMVAPYAVNVQVKMTLTMPDGKKGAMDFDRVVAILKKTNYRGFVVLEYEEPGDVVSGCRHGIELLRKALRSTQG